MDYTETTAGASNDDQLLTQPMMQSTHKRIITFTFRRLVVYAIIFAIVIAFLTNLDRIIISIADEVKSSNSNSGGKRSDDDSSDDDSSDDALVLYEFGHEMGKHFTNINSSLIYRNLNWGHHGGCPDYVIDRHESLREEIDVCRNCWHSNQRIPLIQSALQALAEYLNIEDPEDLVFVDNTSHGINSVLRSLNQYLMHTECGLAGNCRVLRFNTAYPMVKTAIEYQMGEYGVVNSTGTMTELVFDFTPDMYCNTSLLLDALEAFILLHSAPEPEPEPEQESLFFDDQNVTIYAAFVTEIITTPAVKLDMKAVCALLRAYNILCIVDAAHSLGQIAIDMADMAPDVWIATGYKWFYAPKGSGLMYVSKHLQSHVFPTVINGLSNTGDTLFQVLFGFAGEKDYTPWIAMHYALEYRQFVGDAEILEYIHNLAVIGGQLIADVWGTELVVKDPAYIGSMATIRFPIQNATELAMYGINAGAILAETDLFIRMGLDANGVHTVRVSAQVFHEISDFEVVAHAVLEYIAEQKTQFRVNYGRSGPTEQELTELLNRNGNQNQNLEC